MAVVTVVLMELGLVITTTLMPELVQLAVDPVLMVQQPGEVDPVAVDPAVAGV